jgi:DNA invertase Pin-like site-specific DNA recombinase
MMTQRAVAYYRVSTAKQGTSGLGLEAQQAAVEALCASHGWELVAPPFVEVESGKRHDRTELAKAIQRAKRTGATLVVAKLDRLARDVKFLLTLIDGGADVVFCDLPTLPAGPVGRFMLTQMAAVAELEAGLISQRTRAALAAAKVRAEAEGVGRKADGTPWKTGARLGNPNGAAAFKRAGKGNAAAVRRVVTDADARAEELRETISELRLAGIKSLGRIAYALNERHEATARGGRWHASSVSNLLARLGPAE